jgi:activator of 2-hydroxyglutaryl-CoA dehydratase
LRQNKLIQFGSFSQFKQFINLSWREIMNRRGSLKSVTASIVLGFGSAGINVAHAADAIKMGILHSLSGSMAISETVRMAIQLLGQDMQAKRVRQLVAL